MDNLELSHFKDTSYDSSITGRPVIYNVADNVCCFITDTNKLVIKEYFKSTNIYEIDNAITNSATQIKYIACCNVLFIATRRSILLYDPVSTTLTILHLFANDITTTSWNPNETILVVVDVNNVMYTFTFEEGVILSHSRIREINNVLLDDPAPGSVYVGWGSHNTQFTGAPKIEGGIKEELLHNQIEFGKQSAGIMNVEVKGEFFEEAAESSNKLLKILGRDKTRKMPRVLTNTDLLHGLLLYSDLVISSLRKLPASNKLMLLHEVFELLELIEVRPMVKEEEPMVKEEEPMVKEEEPMVKEEEEEEEDEFMDDVSEPDEHIQGPPVISWRRTGEQFVVNYRKNDGRVLKVFGVHLNPQHESETYANLLSPTSFAGQGSFIACGNQEDGNNYVTLFEKNCQIKSQFAVPLNEGFIKHIECHPDINLMAVYSAHARYGVLNVYLNSNARWYLKQQIVYPMDQQVLSFNWASLADRTTYILNVLTVTAMERLTFKMVINSYPETNLAAVIDGPTVHFTRFFDEIVPPPMASISLTFERPIRAILFDPMVNRFLFITSTNTQHNYIYDGGMFIPHDGTGLANFALNDNNNDIIKRLEVVSDGINYEIILDRNLDLTINGSVVCSNVLSMYIHQIYLILSHAFCRLYCIRLTQENLSNANWDLDKFYSREVEQGSKIVGISRGIDIIIELPRGNLEAVTCRIIAVDTIQVLLNQNQWQDAIDYIRDLRLNWNLLIDLDPSRFSGHIPDFIAAAESTSALNNIVSEFSSDNCLDTMYQQCLIEDRPPFFEYNKRDIFLELLEEMNRLNPVMNLNGIVAIQTKHFTVKAALKSVCDVFLAGELLICKRAMSRMLLYRNGRDMIRDAYSLYNVAFLTFVYTCCSEDPRAFVPELNTLLVLRSAELRYKMNLLSKNYPGATKYLVRLSGVKPEYAVEFIIKHETQKIAYENTCQNNPNFRAVSKLYANFLAQRTRYDEAGLILMKAQMYTEAMEEYKKALNWRQVVSILEMIKAKISYKREILLSLANDLVNHKRVDEAVMLYEYHCEAYGTAIEVLTDKKMFEKALCLAKKYNAKDALANIVVPAIVQYKENLKEKIMSYETFFLECYERLQKVRQQKYLTFRARRYNQDEDLDDNNDLHSEYGSVMSVASGSSRGSTMSSRNRRKQEKKKTDLRKGGVYEDIALIRQLYLLITESFELGQDVRDICLTLTDSESLSLSAELHQRLSNLQDFVKDHIPRIWSKVFLEARASAEPSVLAVVENRSELADAFKTPPPEDQLRGDWKLAIFTRNLQ